MMRDFFLHLKDYASRDNIILTVLISAVGELFVSGIVGKIRHAPSEQETREDKKDDSGIKRKSLDGKQLFSIICWFIVLCVIVFILLAANDYLSTPPEGTPTPTTQQKSSFPSVGETVEFGTYWQTRSDDGNWRLDPITWRVLSQNNGLALLISEQGLTYKPISDEVTGDGSLIWEESDLYKWLHTDFCSDSYFTEKEKQAIVKDSNNSYMVSCLDKNETEICFPGPTERICKPTEYAAYICENSPTTNAGKKPVPSISGDFWWLREPGEYASYMTVSNTGIIKEDGTRYTYYGIMVRPTIWIYMDQFMELDNS